MACGNALKTSDAGFSLSLASPEQTFCDGIHRFCKPFAGPEDRTDASHWRGRNDSALVYVRTDPSISSSSKHSSGICIRDTSRETPGACGSACDDGWLRRARIGRFSSSEWFGSFGGRIPERRGRLASRVLRPRTISAVDSPIQTSDKSVHTYAEGPTNPQ